MPGSCSVPFCKSNYQARDNVSVYSFPKDENLRRAWVTAIKRKDFTPTKHSRVCIKHFKETDIMTTTSAFDEKTGKLVTAKLDRKRLLPGAVPSIFPDSTSSYTRKIRHDKRQTKERKSVKTGIVKSLQEKTTSGETESLKVDETSTVIKQEPDESVDDPPRLVIEQIQGAEEIASSSKSSLPLDSSSFSCGSTSFQEEKALPLANHDSSTVDGASAGHIAKKPVRKRKLKGDPTTPDEARVKSYRGTKPSLPSKLSPRTPIKKRTKSSPSTIPSMQSKRTSKPQVGTAKKSAGGSTLPTKIDENATRNMFESLLDSSENNPLFESRTTKMPGDLFDVFADLIANKLREMEWDDFAFALRAILNIVFKAGKVQHDSEVD